jgi:hypothetical protein
MVKTLFRDLRPSNKLLFTGFVVVIAFFFTQIIAAILAIPLFGLDQVMKMLSGLDFSDPDSMNLLKYFRYFNLSDCLLFHR